MFGYPTPKQFPPRYFFQELNRRKNNNSRLGVRDSDDLSNRKCCAAKSMESIALISMLRYVLMPLAFLCILQPLAAVDGPAVSLPWGEISNRYEVPQWYRVAKLGIWAHWGPQSQPLKGGGWYARHMYMQQVVKGESFGKDAYAYHIENFGHPSEKGYMEVLNAWKAEKFDANVVVGYAKNELGADFFMALANHHDHFDNFDSSHHPWNSMRVGPKRDIVGEFAEATRKAGLRFAVSSHDDRFLSWWLPAFGSDRDGPKRGVLYDGNKNIVDGKGLWWEGFDPALLYGLPPSARTPAYSNSVKENWLERHVELVEKYRPDMVWFDGFDFPYGNYGKRFAEFYFNQALQSRGSFDVVLAGKPKGSSFKEPKGWVRDFELGVPTRILNYPWQTCMTVDSWFYKNERIPRQNSRTLIETFVDIISKNGLLLLNLELAGDGTIPSRLKPDYDQFGAWVLRHREAILGTHAWKIHGDNLSMQSEAKKLTEADPNRANDDTFDFNQRTKQSPVYPHDEVRFTVRDKALYVFVLNPTPGMIKIPALGYGSPYRPGKITSAHLLSTGISAVWSQTDQFATLEVPSAISANSVLVFSLHGAAGDSAR